MLLVVFATLEIALLQTSTEAGTTGALRGRVLDERGAPIAGALVQVVSPSQTASVTTDPRGYYAFLDLAPDTYTLTAAKRGQMDVVYPGIVIFADQTEVLAVKMSRRLKEIARVTAAAQGSLVKAGTTVDVYAVNEATAAQLQTLGGGNNLNSAYSAIYSVPGVNSLPGNFGFGQEFYIHGSSYGQVGYEFDGIPVNRAFDNYNASSLSNLGIVSTEVYTSGGPAVGPSATLGGYINQVVKTGTFPGYATAGAGIGSPGFYHALQLDAGGATPDRNFSWYVGLRGDNLIPNQLNAENGSNLLSDGDNRYGIQGVALNVTLLPLEDWGIAAAPGPWSTCLGNGTPPKGSSAFSPLVAKTFFSMPSLRSCEVYGPIYGALTSALSGNDLSDRENVMNFHIGVPHRFDAGRDDIQLLFDNFYYQTTSFDNVSSNGGLAFSENAFASAGGPSGLGLYNTFLNDVNEVPPSQQMNFLGPAQMRQYPGLCAYINFYAFLGYSNPCASSGYSPMPYADAFQVVHASFGQPAANAAGIIAPYFFPSSPAGREFGSGFSPYQSSNTGNNGSIAKVQYTRNVSPTAYLRLLGYTFYSDWLANDPNYGIAPFLTGQGTAADYELNTHTFGGGLQFADQLSPHHLLSIATNYVTANTQRVNNLQYVFTPNGTPIATLMSPNGMCYSGESNNPTDRKKASAPRVDGSYPLDLPIGSPVSCLSALAGVPINAVINNELPAPVGQAAGSGATWRLTQNLEPFANKNTVGPRFLNLAIADEFRPTDRWDFNAGLRFESYGYALGDLASPEQAFWFKVINETVCVDPDGLSQVPATDFTGGAARSGTVPFGYPDYYTTVPGKACRNDPLTGDKLYHPGQHAIPQVALGSTGTLTDRTSSARVGFTFTASPNSVIRFAYGRYTQPSITATEQVLTYEDGYQMALNLYGSAFYNIGLASITHNNPIQFSNSWDASFEQRLRGTEWSFKISPYYRYTSGESVLVPLAGGIPSSFNAGTGRAAGLEVAVQEGDPSRNGWSGQLAYTYTLAQVKYALINGSNVVATEISNLKDFYGLTKNGGGAPCYDQAVPVKVCAADRNAVVNPYYNLLPNDETFADVASAFPITGWYPVYADLPSYGLQTGDTATALSPNIIAGFLSYKHNKLQATLTANLWQGTQYGSPTDIAGLDPRSCFWNQSAAGVVPGSQRADYQTCGGRIAIPNPFTGEFSAIGAYRQPWQLNLGAQVGYALTARITLTVALANVFNTCFGGSAEPWTAAYPPNSIDCAYAANSRYLAWSPGEAWNTAGAGYFYGNNPHAAINGTAGYPKIFDQAYIPGAAQVAAPFQAFIQAQVKL